MSDPSVVIRAAAPADAAAIAQVHVRGWQEAYIGQVPQAHLDAMSVDALVAVWQRWLGPGASQSVLVAIDGGDIVAFIAVAVDADADAVVGEVAAIYARARVWGTGVGGRLMTEGLRILRACGCTEATLWVLETNVRARRFYEAGGWSFDGAAKVEEIGGATVTELRYRCTLDALSP